MDLKQLFGELAVIPIEYGESHKFFFYFRNPTSDEDLEFRRRTSRMQMRGGKLEPSEGSLQAPLWYFEKICTRIAVQNGTGALAEDVSEEDKKLIPASMKMKALNKFQERIQESEEEILKN